MLNFPTLIPECDTNSSALLDNPIICSTVSLLPLGNSNYVVVSVSIDFLSSWKGDVPFHRTVYDNSRADWDGLYNYLRDAPWEDIFNGAPTPANEFCEWIQV